VTNYNTQEFIIGTISKYVCSRFLSRVISVSILLRLYVLSDRNIGVRLPAVAEEFSHCGIFHIWIHAAYCSGYIDWTFPGGKAASASADI
jgi:hypothetical protein